MSFPLNLFIPARAAQNRSSIADNGKVLKLFPGLLHLLSAWIFFSCRMPYNVDTRFFYILY